MKFVDEVRIHVKAGDGGNGAVAWRREKFIPRGGPAGGDGGNGGDVVLIVDPQLSTLLDYRYVREHKARSGGHGLGSDMNGQDGVDLELRVPPGTVVKDAATGEVLAEGLSPVTADLLAKLGAAGEVEFEHFVLRMNHAQTLVGASRPVVLGVHVEPQAANVFPQLRPPVDVLEQRAKQAALPVLRRDIDALNPPKRAVPPITPFVRDHQLAHELGTVCLRQLCNHKEATIGRSE